MPKKLSFLLVLSLSLILTACNSQAPAGHSSGKTAGHSKKGDPGATALTAWREIEPEVKQWSSNYKIIKIQDSSYAKFQRRDGLADVWEFYVADCQQEDSAAHLCRRGQTRSYYYSTTKGGWGPKGVSAHAPQKMYSREEVFSPEQLKIDTDRAVELARTKLGHPKNSGEEFIISTFQNEAGEVYWHIVRQCFLLDKSCDSHHGWSAYVNTKTGEVTDKKPR